MTEENSGFQDRPDPRVVAAARDRPHDESVPTAVGSFRLHDWMAILPDLTVPDDPYKHPIWHEGKPADIPTFEGERIIILAPPTFARYWNAPRDFPPLFGELQLVRVLDGSEVRGLLARLAHAPRPES